MTFFLSFILLFLTSPAYSAQVTLAWDCPKDSLVTGYHIYYGESVDQCESSSPYKSINDPNQNSTLISGLAEGQEYIFEMTSFDAYGNESDFSEPLYYTIPVTDTDGDGLSDKEETETYITDPNLTDTDGDGLDDGQEVNSYNTDPNVSDTDGDGLNDGQEVNSYGTDPLASDTDGDGLSDAEEVNNYNTDPNMSDTDGDSLSDGQEINTYSTDPNMVDTDTDSLTDDQEVNTYNTDPNLADTDCDGLSDGEEVSQGIDPLVDNSDELTIVRGSIPLDHNWVQVSLSQSFNDPVVVAGPLTYNGGNPSVVRIRNVTDSGFEIRIDEYEYLDEWHTIEAVDFMVMEKGRHILNDGTEIEAGSFQTQTSWPYFKSIIFSEDFLEVPVIMTTVVSENEAQAVTGRLQNISQVGFDYSLREEEASDQIHAVETINYIAWEPSSGTIGDMSYEVVRTADSFDSRFSSVTFQQDFASSPVFLASMQSCDGGDTADLRVDNKTNLSIEIQIDEETSSDSETSHTTEALGYIALEDQQMSSKEPVIISGQLTVNHQWSTVVLNQTFTDPIIVAGPLSRDGGNPAGVRIRNLTGSSFEIRVDEYEYLDEWHVLENVDFLMMERDQYRLSDGTKIKAGYFQTGTSYPDFAYITFMDSFNEDPVVITTVVTENEKQAVAGRIRNVDKLGFEFALQEEEAGDQVHSPEMVHYIAWEPSYGVVDGLNFEVVRTENSITDDLSLLNFQNSFSEFPVFLGDMQTCDGGDTANLRTDSKTNTSIQVQVDEEQSNDSEVDHTTESVGYLTIEPTNQKRW